MSEKLTQEEVLQKLNSTSGWVLEGNSIKKRFVTRNYPSTMGFVTAVGGLCQRHNHHPDYVLMWFKEVEVSFSTHSAGGVTQKDVDIALEIEKIPI